jgi:hypothetical protein
MNRPLSRLFASIVIAGAAAVVTGCGSSDSGDSGGSTSSTGSTGSTGSSGSSPPGALRVSLTDAPSCGYDAVHVTVSKVRVHQSSTANDTDAGWSDIVLSPPRRVDLLGLSNGVLFELGQVALPSGRYQQLRLVLADNATTPLANAVVPAGGSETPLDTPSAQQSGIKLQANVDVPAGQTVDVVLDFDACRSVVRRGNSGRYNLKPVIAVIPVISVGSISGYAAAAAPAPADGVKVSAQVNGTVVKETAVASGAQFTLSPIAAGTYDVVFTAAGRTTRVVTGVPVFTAGNTVMNTPATPISEPSSPVGTVGGRVTPAAAQAAVRALQSIGASRRVEVGTVNADGLTGDYALALPTAPVEVASPIWPSPPIATPPAYVFAAVPGSGGSYTLEASALGYGTGTSSMLAIPAGGSVTQNFTLIATP